MYSKQVTDFDGFLIFLIVLFKKIQNNKKYTFE